MEAVARMARILERSSGDLSLAHYRVLAMVAEGSDRGSRLAQRLALGKPAISAAVESLCARGLLLRSDSDPDCRAIRLEITTAGEALLQSSEGTMANELAEVIDRARRPDALRRALDDLSSALARRPADGEARRPVRDGTVAKPG